MTHIAQRLQRLLDESGAEYEIIHHRDDFRATTTAADTLHGRARGTPATWNG